MQHARQGQLAAARIIDVQTGTALVRSVADSPPGDNFQGQTA